MTFSVVLDPPPRDDDAVAGTVGHLLAGANWELGGGGGTGRGAEVLVGEVAVGVAFVVDEDCLPGLLNRPRTRRAQAHWHWQPPLQAFASARS